MKNVKRIMLILSIGVVMLSAQEQEMMGGRFQRPAERLEHFKKIRMIEVLKLDEETGDRKSVV